MNYKSFKRVQKVQETDAVRIMIRNDTGELNVALGRQMLGRLKRRANTLLLS